MLLPELQNGNKIKNARGKMFNHFFNISREVEKGNIGQEMIKILD